jgi:peroxiredoxin
MLGVGDKAPLFAAAGSDGEVDLGRLLENGAVVLYFFPRALTPG